MVTTSWITVLLASMLSAGSAAAETSGGRPAEPDEAAQVRGNTEFAFDLFGRLRARDGNVFFSPYSISNALAMTYAGARGPTATQMARVLHFPFEEDRLHRSFAGVIGKVTGSARHAELRVANALWPQAGFPITPDFQAIAQKRYGAGLDAQIRRQSHLMISTRLHLLRLFPFLRGGHRQLALENLALCQQLAVYKRTASRPKLRRRERFF